MLSRRSWRPIEGEGVIELPSARSRLNDGPREPEKLRGRIEPGGIDVSFVDIEMDVMTFGRDQIDHSAPLRELIHVANGEDRSAAHCREDPAQIPALRGTDEEEFTTNRLLQPPQPPDYDDPSLRSLALHHVIQRRTKRILADDADDKGRGRIRTARCGPANVGRELVDEGRLQLILRGASVTARLYEP